jgi:large subunit ribosomal protein L7A
MKKINNIQKKFDELEKVIGIKQVLKHANNFELHEIYLASDADEDFKKQVTAAAKASQASLFLTGSKKELGQICEIDVNAAVVGILK